MVAVDKAGRIGAACHGWTFKYSVRDASMDEVQVVSTQAIRPVHMSSVLFHGSGVSTLEHG